MVRPPDKLPGKSSRELYIVPSQATTATYLPSLKTAGGSASPNPSPTVSTTTLTPADSSDLPYVPFSDNHKRLMVAIVAFTGMVAPFSSEVFLPALTDMVTDFGTSVTMINGAVAVFMMALAIAPLFWGVLADNYGRRPAYAAGTLLCTAASTGCALAVNPAMLIVMRFLQAVGGSVLVAGGAGTISDIYEPARRGSALGLYFGGQMVGPILGTILGGYVGQAHGWRWTFWMTAILSGISWFLLTVVLPETHRVLVVQRHQVDLRGLTQDDVQSRPPVNWRAAFNPRTVFRPLHLPYVAIPVLIMTVIMASYYAMLTVTSTIFKLDYGYSTATVGLYFLAPGVGNVIGAVGCGWLSDRTMKWCLQRRQAKRIDAVTAADAIDYLAAVEGRLPPLLVAMVIYPVCYLIFAWLVQFHAPIATALSMQFIIGLGMTAAFAVISAYLVDLFSESSAAITSMANLFRCSYTALWLGIVENVRTAITTGGAFTILGASCFVGTTGAFLLFYRGEAWRRRSFEMTTVQPVINDIKTNGASNSSVPNLKT